MVRLDASRFWYEVGRQLQTVSVVMDKHTIVPDQQLCACGQVAVRVLPTFGLRCQTACEQWELACLAIRRILEQLNAVPAEYGVPLHAVPPDPQQPGPAVGRAIGRATPYRGF
ncbi:MAG: hypothetical protein ACRDT4_10365 [Micromonosporaceae bacterium]